MSGMKDLHLSYYEEAIERGECVQDAEDYANYQVARTEEEMNNWLNKLEQEHERA